jgi:DNA-binding transcriptional MocR family regulator
VNQEPIAVANVLGGNHVRLAVGDEADVADERLIEDRVDPGTVVDTAFGHAPHPDAVTFGALAETFGHLLQYTSLFDLVQMIDGVVSHRKLVDAIERAVRSGTLKPGERLPSVRACATAAGLSPTTVAAAYADLRRRGIVVTQPKSGVRVAARPPLASADSRRTLRPAVPYDLSGFRGDPQLLPDITAAIRACADDPRPLGGYDDDPVDERLRDAARRLVGDDADAAVTVTSGALDGVERALATVAVAGDPIAVEDPGHANLLDLLRSMNLVALPVAVDDEGPRPEPLAVACARGARAVIITRRAQDPFGSALTDQRARALRAVVAAYPEILVIEDDHLGQAADPSAGIAGHSPRWVAVSSLAKAFGPDLRIALVAGDPHTTSRMAGRFAVGPGWVSHILQRTAAHLLDAPTTPAILDTARRVYNERREALHRSLTARGLTVNAASGLACWVAVRDETTTCLRLREQGVLVNPGARYRIAAAPAIRVATANLVSADAERIADLISDAVAPSRRRSA